MTWGFRHWLLLTLAAGMIVAYVGILGPVHDFVTAQMTALEMRAQAAAAQLRARVQSLRAAKLGTGARRLAADPRVAEAFADPLSGRGEAAMALLIFMFVTPIAVIMGVAILLLVLTAVANVVGNWIGSQRLAMFVVCVVCAVAIYIERDLWLPDLTYVSGLVIRAYLVATQAA